MKKNTENYNSERKYPLCVNTSDSHVFQEIVSRRFAQEAMSFTFFLSKYLFLNHKNFTV
jgi:hypothetical protein